MSFTVSDLTGSKKGHSPFHRPRLPSNSNGADGDDSLLQSEKRAYKKHSHLPRYPG